MFQNVLRVDCCSLCSFEIRNDNFTKSNSPRPGLCTILIGNSEIFSGIESNSGNDLEDIQGTGWSGLYMSPPRSLDPHPLHSVSHGGDASCSLQLAFEMMLPALV